MTALQLAVGATFFFSFASLASNWRTVGVSFIFSCNTTTVLIRFIFALLPFFFFFGLNFISDWFRTGESCLHFTLRKVFWFYFYLLHLYSGALVLYPATFQHHPVPQW